MQMSSGHHVLMFGGALNIIAMVCAISRLMPQVCRGSGEGHDSVLQLLIFLPDNLDLHLFYTELQWSRETERSDTAVERPGRPNSESKQVPSQKHYQVYIFVPVNNEIPPPKISADRLL